MKIFNIIALFSVLLFVGCIDYSDGTRSGYVIKFSRKGLVCKTWEGTMNLGGTVQGENGIVANTWNFTIDPNNSEDQKLIPILNQALELGKRVKVTYQQEAITSPCRSDSNYFLKSVTIE